MLSSVNKFRLACKKTELFLMLFKKIIFLYRETGFGVWSAKYEDEGAKIYNDYFYVTFGTIAVRTKTRFNSPLFFKNAGTMIKNTIPRTASTKISSRNFLTSYCRPITFYLKQFEIKYFPSHCT